ncbi:unnamed protein product, partial [marine sediment metagenome]
MKEIRGIIPTLLTPFNDNNKVDKEVMLRQIYYAIEQNPNALGVNGEASE